MLIATARTLLILVWCLSSTGLADKLKKTNAFYLTSGIFPPYTTLKRNGFEDLLAIELYTRLGLQTFFNNISGERGLVNLNQGHDDGILSRIAGLEKLYPNILPINEVVVEWKFVAFTNNKKIHIQNWADLARYDVAFLTGWKIFDLNVKKYRSLRRVNTPRQLFQFLDAKRVDVVLYALEPGKLQIKNLGLNNIVALQPSLATKQKYFYVHKKHKHLISRAVETLKNIKKDGTYNKLYKMAIPN